MKLPGRNYLRERAGFREAFDARGTHPAWIGWKGRGAFPVRGPEDGETRDDTEWEAFRAWFHAKHRAPALDALHKGKRTHCIPWQDAWDGWRARYQWKLAGQPVKTLLTGYDYFGTLWIITIVLWLIFGHY
jgi:hypothetical protein